jgi:putative NADH-flavin reductase
MPGQENHDVALHAQLRLFCRLMLGSADAADCVIRQVHRRALEDHDEHPSERARLFRIAADLCGAVAAVLPGLDVLISGFGAGNAAEDPADAVEIARRISAEDAAVAVLDEAELPRFSQRRFTIGY